MKILKYSLIILFTSSLSAQSLTQKEFERINSDIRKILISINKSDDFQKLIDKFKLSKADSTQMENLILKNDIIFSKNMNSKSHIFPFYFLTDNPNELKLTVFSLTTEPKRKGEEFYRGDYHFVLTSIVNIENESLIYKNTNLITDPDSINTWFLNGYNSYLDKTKPVFDKFKYTPPPPPLPPNKLE